jgi:hypothetical protein
VVTRELLAELESHVARDYRPLSERIHYELTISEDLPMENFTIACQAELLGRILSFGSRAEPLSPPELRARWQSEVAAMSALARGNHYTNDGDTIGRAGDI